MARARQKMLNFDEGFLGVLRHLFDCSTRLKAGVHLPVAVPYMDHLY